MDRRDGPPGEIGDGFSRQRRPWRAVDQRRREPFSDRDGTLEAILDFHLVTKWKTAGDSLLAALKLAPKDTRTILIVGAGTVARSLREAYGAAFPDARFLIWNRSQGSRDAPCLVVSRHQVVDDLARR
jgi:ornithine cyclodeaminase/alanine dehydrogenase-like protein (mu-crystallin family)